jgi:hypothetical protein
MLAMQQEVETSQVTQSDMWRFWFWAEKIEITVTV